MKKFRSSRPEVFRKKVFLKILQIHRKPPVPESQLFSCEFCEIFKNTYFYRTPLVAASKS